MKSEAKEELEVILSLLKTTMRRHNLLFGILVDRANFDNSSIAFIEKGSYSTNNKDGIVISLNEMNK